MLATYRINIGERFASLDMSLLRNYAGLRKLNIGASSDICSRAAAIRNI